MADNPSAAYPVAPPDLAQEILDLVQQASHYKQLKKGANEGITQSEIRCVDSEERDMLIASQLRRP